MYEVVQPDPAIPIKLIYRTADGVLIPTDEGNRDFQAFLEWNSRQSTPLVWE